MLFKIIRHQPDIDKTYLYAKHQQETKLISNREGFHWIFKWYRLCLWKYWWMQSKLKSKALIVFDDSNKKSINPIVTELSNSCRKLNVSLAFTVQSYFAVPKNIKLNFTHYSFTKVPNKREFQQIAVNYSSDIAFKDFMNLDKECTKK